MLAAALSSPPQAIHLHPNLCPPSLCPCPTQLSRRLPPRSEKKCWLRKMRRALQHDDSPWLAALLPGALDIPVPLSHVLMGACSVGATSCSRLLIEAKADIYEQVPPGHLGEGDTALNIALKTYSHPEDDRVRAGARACALMLLECSPGFGDKDRFIFSSEHAQDLVVCCSPVDLHGQYSSDGKLPAVQLLLAARVDPNVAFDYNALIRDRVADDEGE